MSKSNAKFAGQDLRSRINQIRELKAAGDQLEDSDDISLSSIDTLPLNSPTRTEKRTRSHSETRHRPVSRTSTRSRSPVAKSRSPLRSSEGKSPRRQTKAKTSKHHKRSKEKRSRSKSAKKSKKKSKKKKLAASPVSSASLSPERPPRRVHASNTDDVRRPYRPKNHHRSYPPKETQSWEDKVSEFMNKINSKESSHPPEEEVESSMPVEDLKLSPLMKFIATKLSVDKSSSLFLRGPFHYNILSLLSRTEWVALKSVKLLEEAGHDTDWLYDTAAIKGSSGLKQDLVDSLDKNTCFNQYVQSGFKSQMKRIFTFVIKYFTDEDVEIEHEDVAGMGDEDEGKPDVEEASEVKTRGIGAVLDRIQASALSPPPPPPPPPQELPPQQEINHWSMLADNIQASSLSSFEKLESYLSQDLLRLSSNSLEQAQDLLKINNRPAKDAFEVARHMVMCWVNTGYSFPQLWSKVNQSNVEDILPPRDPNDTSGFNILDGPRNEKYLASKFLHQLKRLNKSMNDKQVDYVVWKTLLYVMRGCGKVVQQNNVKGFKVSYNYLPPGLRELEAGNKYSKDSSAEVFVDTPQDLSEDPMNIIIDPYAAGKSRAKISSKGQAAEVMPRRKYFIAAVHLEWIVFKGKPEIYEIGIHCQDMSKLELVIIPEALKVDQASLEALGFTLNRNLNKYFYVQSGMGCVTALTMKKAVEKLMEFLDKKRLAEDENQNNGLVMLLKDKEHLSCWTSQILVQSPELTIETVKGFGLLSSICTLADPQMNLVGNECCLSAQVLSGSRSEGVLAKSKAELLFKALEAGLQVCNPGYDSFVQPYGFPADGIQIKAIKHDTKQLEEMYNMELFIANELKNEGVEIFLEGIYSVDKDKKDLRHKCDIVAHKFCQALVEAKINLEKHLQRPSGMMMVFNPDPLLNLMDKPQRLKVLNQTRACADFVHRYLSMQQQSQAHNRRQN